MSLPILCFLVVIGLVTVGAFVFLRMPHIVAIFSDKHYAEVAQGLVGVKAAALARVNEDESPPTPDDPRVLRTSADLVVLYTITPQKSEFAHQYSVSTAGRVTLGAVGEIFSVYIAYLLGVDVSRIECRVSENRVFHTYFTLTPDEQEEFAARPVTVPSDAAEAKRVNAEVLRLRDSVSFAPMMVGTER